MEDNSGVDKALEKIIAFANQKGGVGKTTTAVSLGGYIARRGVRVLLVDIDPQGNAVSGFGIDIHKLEKTIYDVLTGSLSCSEVILPTSLPNLSILPANVNLAGIEIDILEQEEREYILKKALLQVLPHYDYILIDCPPNLGILTLNAMCAANRVIITLQTEYYALEGLTQLMKVIHLVQKSLNPSLTLDGVVLTMYDSRTSLSQQVVEDVKSHFRDKVYSTIIPRSIRLAEAPSYGCYIGEYAPESSGALAYNQLSLEVMGRK